VKEDYVARINRVIDHIEANLERNLTLDELARVASFSPYHFHRIFGAMVGETLNRFIWRLRLERAASKLVQNPNRPVTEIALDCGFSSSATFARAFQKHFGASASEWRKMGKPVRNEGQPVHNPGQAFDLSGPYLDPTTRNMNWRIEMKGKTNLSVNVEVRELPERHVAYVRHVGPYKGDTGLFGRLFEKLITWAGPRDLLGPDSQMMTLYHDDPEITEEEKLRISVCLTVPEDTEVDGEVGKTKVAGGKYAVGKFELDPDQYPEAWASIYGGWLPQSGFQPDDRPAFELYLNDPKEHPEHKCIVEIAVPVKPM
jgi:AraC family transcriptional regulator